jgi:ABC-type amino acid transport substrate-binding protein
MSRARLAAAVLGCAALLAGCSIPTDFEDTLARVRDGGVMRVGMSASDPWTELVDGRRGGVEVELVEGFARSLGAQIAWTDGGEQELVESLHHGRLDLVIGGITAKSPWKKQAAPTRPFATTPGDFSPREKHVMLVRPGENDFLTELDVFLQEREGAIARRLAEEGMQ